MNFFINLITNNTYLLSFDVTFDSFDNSLSVMDLNIYFIAKSDKTTMSDNCIKYV